MRVAKKYGWPWLLMSGLPKHNLGIIGLAVCEDEGYRHFLNMPFHWNGSGLYYYNIPDKEVPFEVLAWQPFPPCPGVEKL